jgi:hypothetical protein
MSEITDTNAQKQGADNTSKYSLLRYNVKALLALFFVAVCGRVVAYRSYITAFITGHSAFGSDFYYLH